MSAPGQSDRILRQREYDKAMKRMYRAREKAACQALLAQVVALEAILAPLAERHRRDFMGGLPWKEIALGLRENLKLSLAQNKALREQVAAFGAMAHAVVVATTPAPLTSLLSNVPTWHDMTLSAHPTTRQLGQAWIINRLMRTGDRMFQLHGFPLSGDTMLQDATVDATSRDVVIRYEGCTTRSMSHLLHHFCHHDGHSQGDTCNVIDDSSLHHVTTRYRRLNGRPGELVEDVNILTGCVHYTDGRVLVVARTITHEEVLPGLPIDTRVHRHRQSWLEMRPLSPTTTLLRLLVLVQAPTMVDTMEEVELEDEAAMWGLKTMPHGTESRQEANLRQEILQECKRLVQHVMARADACVDRTVASNMSTCH
ncbi:Aste57867_1910 [Aphanomyces stellatus]|uniref:Aste57867_1910 protein n=1 Tax=Aphanomyces stellatus TaxID=120398 RepID=A0A485K7C7_9STRA|nr:hypothetical protein As57867_001908 [Aphanomyces stellatus]VFT79116.1 Aste57867_1910 [Aphanomyces stellatus]